MRILLFSWNSISWDYNVVGELVLEDFENSRPARRSHFEMVLPRKVRQDMLRREWDVTQREIAAAVRQNVKVKNQRKSTVNNLNKATKMEEALESLSRKLKRVVSFQKPVHRQVKELESKFDEAQRQRAQLRLQVQMAQDCDVSTVGSSG